MFDVSNNIRTSYLSILDGNISYNGKNVPVYGNDPFNTTPQNYIIISDIVETQDNNNQKFVTSALVTIDIYSEQYLMRDNSIVDNISNQILTLLIPNTGQLNIGNLTFQIFALSRLSSRYLSLQDGQNYIVRKIITINNSIVQN
jgi:hypothetical protein